MNSQTFDIRDRARQAMIEAGFQTDFPAEVMQEVQAALKKAPAQIGGQPRDLRSLLWSSIDNRDSRDLDQIEYAETRPDGAVRLLIGIADVDAYVPKGSATDAHAAKNTSTVYTGVSIFPMLPEEFSTQQTSLLDNCERLAMVIELRIQNSGEVDCADVYPARVFNRAKLTYGAVGDWLEGHGPIPPPVANVPGMEAQIRLQQETAKKLQAFRKEQGALTFGSIEPTPVVENGVVKDLVVRRHSLASDIIESFMIAANVAMARRLKASGLLSLQRIVKTPKRWDRIRAIAAEHGFELPAVPDPKPLQEFLEKEQRSNPDRFPDLSLAVVKLLGPGEYAVEAPGKDAGGHFGLAVQDYSHSTAPNRRYADLITQRLLKAAANKAPQPYTEAELGAIAAHCTEREDAVRKVERLMRKVIACDFLRSRIGEIFEGVITGATPKGTYVRLLKKPAEGMVVRGAKGVDVGDKVKVQLVGVDMARGFIDFARI